MSQALDAFVSAYDRSFAYAYDNEIMLNWYPKRIIERVPAQGRLLELGIGHGFTTARFAQHFSHTMVVDGSAAVVARFRAEFPDCSAEVVEGYFEQFDTDEQFDVIVMGFVLEHVEDPDLVLRHFARFLAPGGRCFVAVPNGESMHRRLGHLAGLLDDVMSLGHGDVALGHLRQYSKDTLVAQLEAAGYAVRGVEGIFLKPFTTQQLQSLALPESITQALCELGISYPELSCALLAEAVIAP
ncbi:class I SAM-dependent methyltransferase [Cupriavidus pauculus]|uniref:class I SAM-dependent methyltransferase n=1 Tax=Cupriavidus pauculus TaxID=82633 RepID=UPI0007834049|nr:class I SAM-dependent methyltransferase [Cupriavidus pauculus]